MPTSVVARARRVPSAADASGRRSSRTRETPARQTGAVLLPIATRPPAPFDARNDRNSVAGKKEQPGTRLRHRARRTEGCDKGPISDAPRVTKRQERLPIDRFALAPRRVEAVVLSVHPSIVVPQHRNEVVGGTIAIGVDKAQERPPGVDFLDQSFPQAAESDRLGAERISTIGCVAFERVVRIRKGAPSKIQWIDGGLKPVGDARVSGSKS